MDSPVEAFLKKNGTRYRYGSLEESLSLRSVAVRREVLDHKHVISLVAGLFFALRQIRNHLGVDGKLPLFPFPQAGFDCFRLSVKEDCP